jgi:putative addiction module component (TIGR02574 family)
MGNPQLIQKVMALPPAERQELAEALWASLDSAPLDDDERAIVAEAARRAKELDRHPEIALSHEEVMRELRRSLK